MKPNNCSYKAFFAHYNGALYVLLATVPQNKNLLEYNTL
jgi:hypothetical protein